MSDVWGVIFIIAGFILVIYNFTVVYRKEGVKETWKKIFFLFLETASYGGVGGLGMLLILLGVIFVFVW
ncbi:hypothetical protein [Thermoflavimicrobium dichotomicum]|uniref:Immunity protein 17 n=1 Tax=Thermoflavimicrobium dichotomicum TaxID=46223 RepID=A0A1I3TJ40_9BACL|nr:hypothetical protein [Thermoflavimicrobium dichotomicum]SFJ71254.1 hypothetical protein SAMN05421852_11831 [Thermoflavimicrobium dichotomicum]